jgi:protein-tyrosine phosphatase
MATPSKFRIGIVCAANVCRSPMAETVLRSMAAASGTLGLEVESAGTRVARPVDRPDPRAEAVLRERGYVVRKGRSRALTPGDFDRFDLLLAMDRAILADMQAMSPPHQRHKLRLWMDFAHKLGGDVPDPYFGNVHGFARVLDLCEAGAQVLLEHWRKSAAAPTQALLAKRR